jgi:hypothetical protein
MLCAIKATKEKINGIIIRCFGKMRNWEPRSKEGFWWGLLLLYLYIYFNRKEKGKFANLK